MLRKCGCILLLIIICLPSLMIYAEVHAQTCLPNFVKISNSYPEYASPNAQITITTNIALQCTIQGYMVVVDIMPTGYNRVISTASGTAAVNKVTTPTDLGPWSLDVVVKLVDYPVGRTLTSSTETVVIQIARGVCNDPICPAHFLPYASTRSFDVIISQGQPSGKQGIAWH